MAVGFARVNTRKIAMAARFGYAPNEVIEDEFTGEYIGVRFDAFRRERKPSSLVEVVHDSPFVRVYWDDPKLSEEAELAIAEDWAETVSDAHLDA